MSVDPGIANQRWFFIRNSQRFGPFNSADLQVKAQRGELLPTDMLAVENKPGAVPAGSITYLFPEVSLSPDLLVKRKPVFADPPQKRKRNTQVGGGSWLWVGF